MRSGLIRAAARRMFATSSARSEVIELPIDDTISRFRHVSGAANLAVGSVRWLPPTSVPAAEDDWSRYGDLQGLASLREAVLARHGLSSPEKVGGGRRHRASVGVTVTAGANQAFVNVALACLDPGDRVLLCAPYYFSHLAALQLAGAATEAGRFDPRTMQPDHEHIISAVETAAAAAAAESPSSGISPIKMVVLTTPNNPSGAVVEAGRVSAIVECCRRHGTWLVVDEAYADFTFDGARHYDFDALQQAGHDDNDDDDDDDDDDDNDDDNRGEQGADEEKDEEKNHDKRPMIVERAVGDVLIRLHTFSKSLGMAGWRCGYVLYPEQSLGRAMAKVQDAIPTHCTLASQHLARDALAIAYGHHYQQQDEEVERQEEKHWVGRQVSALAANREALWRAVEHTGAARTNGAFYFFVPLPPHWRGIGGGNDKDGAGSDGTVAGSLLPPDDDGDAGERHRRALEAMALGVLGERFGVVVTPGSAFGATGFFRASYGSLPDDDLAAAAQRLEEGLRWLAQNPPSSPI